MANISGTSAQVVQGPGHVSGAVEVLQTEAYVRVVGLGEGAVLVDEHGDNFETELPARVEECAGEGYDGGIMVMTRG